MTNQTVKIRENNNVIGRGVTIVGDRIYVEQDNDDVLTYSLDLSDWLGTDTISTVSANGVYCGATATVAGDVIDLTISSVNDQWTRHPEAWVTVTTAAGQKKRWRIIAIERDGEWWDDYTHM